MIAPTKPAKTRLSPVLRLFLQSLAGALWIAALVFVLEAGTIIMEAWSASGNPLIQAQRKGTTSPPGESPAIPGQETVPSPGCGVLTADAAGLHTCRPVYGSPEWRARMDAILKDTARRDNVYRGFPGLGEEERTAFALMRGEVVLVLDAKGALCRSYGDYVSRRMAETLVDSRLGFMLRKTLYRDFWRRVLVECEMAAAGEEGGGELPLESNGTPVRVERKAGLDGEAVFLFSRMIGRFPSSAPPELPVDSPWEEPFFRYKPNLRQARGAMGRPLDTNAFGYRGRDFIVPKPDGVFRVLCLGGSTTEECDEKGVTYPARLESLLSARTPGTSLEVLNCGISGITSAGHLAKLDEYLAFQPDLVVVYEGVNDLLQTLPGYWEACSRLGWWTCLSRSRFVRAVMPSLLLPDDASLSSDVSNVILTNLEELRKAFASHDTPMVVCAIPYPQPESVTPEQRQFFDYDLRTHWGHPWLSYRAYTRFARTLNAELRDWCRREGLCLIPLDDEFAKIPYSFTDICHMDSAGMEHKARAVMRQLIASP